MHMAVRWWWMPPTGRICLSWEMGISQPPIWRWSPPIKTLPALGQAALLLAGRGEAAADLCSRPTGAGGGHPLFPRGPAAGGLPTSAAPAPPYVLMASPWTWPGPGWRRRPGGLRKDRLAVAALRGAPSLTALDVPWTPAAWSCGRPTAWPSQSARRSRASMWRWPTGGHVVCILTAADSGSRPCAAGGRAGPNSGQPPDTDALARACRCRRRPPPLPEADYPRARPASLPRCASRPPGGGGSHRGLPDRALSAGCPGNWPGERVRKNISHIYAR